MSDPDTQNLYSAAEEKQAPPPAYSGPQFESASATAATEKETFAGAPFLIELGQLPEGGTNNFRPVAALKVTPSLRSSGLLLSLPTEDLKSLLFVLTFLSPNGEIAAPLALLTDAMELPASQVRERMERLCRLVWNGRPILIALKRESGLDAWVPDRQLIAYQEIPLTTAKDLAAYPRATGSRDAVIARSRERYAKPREEVERLIAQLNGWEAPGDAENSDDPIVRVKARLRAVGMMREQADALVSRYSLQKIEQQLDWLPYRDARNPVRYLAAAIENDYAPPRWLPYPDNLTDEPITPEAEPPGHSPETVEEIYPPLG